MIKRLKKIISGGQTGVDQAALDVAIKLNIPHGGFCPKGRKSENGMIPEKYSLQETRSDQYAERTQLNTEYSDATLIILVDRDCPIIGGTKLTLKLVEKLKKPFLVIFLNEVNNNQLIGQWLEKHCVQTLNVAGFRESMYASVHDKTHDLLLNCFK